MSRRRILVVPVTASPTKPLTPSHLKLLLSIDVLVRATSAIADVRHVYHPLAHAGSRQIAGFWEYLDRRYPHLPFDHCSEEHIGELYGEFQRSERVAYNALAPIVHRAAAGWVHPAGERLLDLWESHYRLLRMADPGFGRSGPEPLPADELIELLTRLDLCIDGRPYGAPVYLDGTAEGLPLRSIVGADGHANYLMSTLGEIVPLLAGHDHVVLAHDVEVRADYRTIAHVLTRLGVTTSRLEFPRVPLGGVARSTRFGGWHGYTLGALAPPLTADFGADAFALGMRLYLIAGLGRNRPESFSVALLRRWVHRARRLLDEHGGSSADPAPFLADLAGRQPYVDPYRLLTTLLRRDDSVPTGDLLRVLCGPVAPKEVIFDVDEPRQPGPAGLLAPASAGN